MISNNLTSSSIYVGNGLSTVFSTEFSFADPTQIAVDTMVVSSGLITTLIYNIDYTVQLTLAGDELNAVGSITLAAPLPVGTNLIIYPNYDFLQETAYDEATSFSGATHETDLDKLTFELQELKFQMSLIPALTHFGTLNPSSPTLVLPQPLSISSSPTFANLTVTGSITIAGGLAGNGTVTQVIAGSGLSGGTITGTGTLAVNIDGLTLAGTLDLTHDEVMIWSAGSSSLKKITLSQLQASGTVTSITSGVGLDVGGVYGASATSTGVINLNINGLSTITNPVSSTDYVAVYNAATSSVKKVLLQNLPAQGTVTSVTGGTGIAGGTITGVGTLSFDPLGLGTSIVNNTANDYFATYNASSAAPKKVLMSTLIQQGLSSTSVPTFAGLTLTGIENWARSADILAAPITDFSAITGNSVHVTGNSSITSFGNVTAGTFVLVTFTGACTLVHSTSLILPNAGANMTTAANDCALFVSESLGMWRCIGYTKASGLSAGRSNVRSDNLWVYTDTSGATVVNSTQSLTQSSSPKFAGLTLGSYAVSTSSPLITQGQLTATTSLPALTGVSTITSGVWHGTIISPTYGGTGVNNGSFTTTLGGNVLTAGALTFSGAFGATLTLTGTTAVIFPTSGTLVGNDTASFTGITTLRGLRYAGRSSLSVIASVLFPPSAASSAVVYDITGSDGFNAINLGTAGDYFRTVCTAGGGHIINSASLILPNGSSDIAMTAGDTMEWLCESSGNWRCISYTVKSGTAFGGSGVPSITGTANQVLANGVAGTPQTGATTLTLPQSIATTSNVVFNSIFAQGVISLSKGTDITAYWTGSPGQIAPDGTGNYYHVSGLSYITGIRPSAVGFTGTAPILTFRFQSQCVLRHKATTSSPEIYQLLLPGQQDKVVYPNDLVAFIYDTLDGGTTYHWKLIDYSADAGNPVAITGGNLVIQANYGGTISLYTPQPLNTTASPTFAGLTLTTALPLTQGGTGATSASAARTALGLGSLATQSGTFSGTSSGTNTGDQTITLTSDVTGSGTGSFATTIANNAVTLAKMATMATSSFLGRKTASTGNVEVLSVSDVTTILGLGTMSTQAASAVSITGGTATGITSLVMSSGAGIAKFSKGADIASTGSLTLGTDGNYFHITGTTTITSFNSLQAGTIVVTEFDGACQLTYNATSFILCNGTSNITTAAGDILIWVSEGSGNWRCISYTKKNGTAPALDTTANPQFATIELGAASDTTLARSGAGDITVEGNAIYRAGGTDVAVVDGGTGVSSTTAYAVICGGTTSTSAHQPIAGVGTAAQVLTSNGAGALPTFQDAAAGSAATQANQETATSTTTFVSPGRQQYHPSAPKAWGVCDLTAALGMSYNISSATDTSTSIKVFNFTTSFSAATYTATCQQYNSGSATYNPNWWVQSRATGAVTVFHADEANNNTNIGTTCQGDQ